MFRLIAIAALCLLAACASTPAAPRDAGAVPMLRLAPSALGKSLALQQRLEFRHGERRDTVDALVEADADAVRLVIHAQGQVALRLDWDGVTLQQTRADWLPAALSGERVLDDLQLVFWPAASIAAALPAPWRIEERDGERRIFDGDVPVVSITWSSPSQASLQQHRQGYQLAIHSVAVTP